MGKIEVLSITDIIQHRALLEVTPSLAKRILDECPYEGQRKLDEMHAYALGETMEKGLFLTDTQITFGLLRGRLFLVNGKHRLHAVGLSGATVSFEAAVYECRSEQELGDLYCRFDTLQRSRSTAQIMAAMGVADEGLLSSSMCSKLYQATPFLMTSFERLSMARWPAATKIVTERMKVFDAYKGAAVAYDRCLEHPGPRYPASRFRSAGIVAVALATLRFSPEKANAFWSGAIANDGLNRGDPRQTFVIDLVRRHKKGGNAFELIEVAATAWNAFYRNKEIVLIRPTGQGPISILGTPFDGRAR